jgi:hypothetical protein
MEREGKWPGVAQGSVRNWPEGLGLPPKHEGMSEMGLQLWCESVSAEVRKRVGQG